MKALLNAIETPAKTVNYSDIKIPLICPMIALTLKIPVLALFLRPKRREIPPLLFDLLNQDHK